MIRGLRVVVLGRTLFLQHWSESSGLANLQHPTMLLHKNVSNQFSIATILLEHASLDVVYSWTQCVLVTCSLLAAHVITVLSHWKTLTYIIHSSQPLYQPPLTSIMHNLLSKVSEFEHDISIGGNRIVAKTCVHRYANSVTVSHRILPWSNTLPPQTTPQNTMDEEYDVSLKSLIVISQLTKSTCRSLSSVLVWPNVFSPDYSLWMARKSCTWIGMITMVATVQVWTWHR